MISHSSLFFFSDELQKAAGMPTPAAAPQQTGPEKKNILTRHMGKSTLLAGGIAGLAALRNPAAAAKYMGQVKDIALRPGTALKRGWRSGATNIRSGHGAREAASKRVSLYKKTFDNAQGGRLHSVEALRPGGTRGSGWLSAGQSTSKGERGRLGQFLFGKRDPTKLNLSPKLKAEVTAAQSALKAGKDVPEAHLAKLYGQIQSAGKAQGIGTKKSLTYYLPGERGLFAGMGVAGGAAGAMESEDPETGRKRGVGERLARGAMGAYMGAALAPTFMGRGAGLSKANIFTGKGNTILSQKGILPIAASFPLMAGGAIATDAAGKGGELADRAFGQKS